MTPYEVLYMSRFAFNVVGLIVCILGLSLARHPRRRSLGYGIAVLGFFIAGLPMLLHLFGFVTPVA
ncbi:hypothetical protein [Litchfieldella xinjiangensis]|uniref:hypothetical protein n=1 Tax=Litchfieldella xinjiangensis TaxID=1166948 RepID=UPI0005BBD88E|nr:hypothetical protein [Halomonas xinjiangensis]